MTVYKRLRNFSLSIVKKASLSLTAFGIIIAREVIQEFGAEVKAFQETQLCAFINLILHKCLCPSWINIPRKADSVKERVFFPVGLGNLQLHSLGIRPVNIMLDLARAVVSIQVLFQSDFHQFNFIKR